MARPAGSQNKDKPFRDALRMELATAGDDHKKLRNIAAKMIALAEAGDMQAIREIGDRLDGKPAQAVEMSGNLGITHEAALDELDDEPRADDPQKSEE